jgi:adenylate cyclase
MEDLEELLLGAPLTLTSDEVMARVPLPEELVDAVWAALGFAKVDSDVVAFTENDVKALQESAALLATGFVDSSTWLVMARTMGQGLARLAEAQLDVFRRTAAGLSMDDVQALVGTAAEEVLPKIEALLIYNWRRQFAAAVQRAFAGERGPGELPTLAVGFVDIVDYTRSSRDWDAGRLERTLETFERDLSLRVAAVGGRVVKTLGDGVLYTTSSPRAAVEVAASRADRCWCGSGTCTANPSTSRAACATRRAPPACSSTARLRPTSMGWPGSGCVRWSAGRCAGSAR